MRVRASTDPPDDNSGRTPLSRAAEDGSEAVVKLLIERDDVDANSEDNSGQTPLWWAIDSYHIVEESEQEAVVKLLLERNVIPDSKNEDGRTPLSKAAGRGHKAIVKLLLERNDVDHNSEDKDGHTPLWWAAEGNDNIIHPFGSWDKTNEEWNERVANKRKEIVDLLTDEIAKRKEAL
ncbi:hypothetical protein VE04_10305 [Pseudogymnoascus sp. 24MN13]|nr:hypothetical protein VE04_10305 [Pseudogymnoascus sp. 24MN13]